MNVYVNIIRDSQRKSLITDLPLYDTTLISTATKTIFALQENPYESCDWERYPKDAKTWEAWKLRYKRAYELWQLAHQAPDGASQFGSVNAAMGAQSSAPWNSNPSDGEPIDYKKLEGYLDNLAHANTNNNVVLKQLSATVAFLTATNAMLVEDIKALTSNNKYLGGLAHSVNTAKPGKVKEKGH